MHSASNNNFPCKVILGISGGVDSSVAAFLLKEQGYQVSAVFMRNWQPETDDPYCTLDQDLSDAKKVCQKLAVPFAVVDFSREYWQRVFQHFLDEYNAGRTPNPDVLCNKEIKFKAFLEYALQSGADYIATGHYVRKEFANGQYLLKKGLDASKDQSYFLYTLGQHELKHSLFPVGDLTKQEVRALAKQIGLENYAKKDSTGICFIGERNFKKFLSEYLLAKPGDIVTPDHQKLGRHDGLMFYTLGQRQGLNIGGVKNKSEAPWYVVQKNIIHNQLVIAQEGDHPLLMTSKLTCHDVNWVADEVPGDCFTSSAKIRYRQSDQQCSVWKITDNAWCVEFFQPQRAITPGQSVVFYLGDICAGGGVIG